MVGLAFWVHLVAALVIMVIMLYQVDLDSETLTKQYTVRLLGIHYVPLPQLWSLVLTHPI
jgi:hypothetical protein